MGNHVLTDSFSIIASTRLVLQEGSRFFKPLSPTSDFGFLDMKCERCNLKSEDSLLNFAILLV